MKNRPEEIHGGKRGNKYDVDPSVPIIARILDEGMAIACPVYRSRRHLAVRVHHPAHSRSSGTLLT